MLDFEFQKWLRDECKLNAYDIVMLAKSPAKFKTSKELFKSEKIMNEELSKIFSQKRKPTTAQIKNAIVRAKSRIRKNIDIDAKEKLGNDFKKPGKNTLLQDQKDALEIAENFDKKWKEYKAQGLSNDDIWGKLNYKKEQWKQTEANDAVNSQYRLHFENSKYDMYWVAILDSKLCKLCKKKNGKRVRKNGEVPPLHPKCRCFIEYRELKVRVRPPKN